MSEPYRFFYTLTNIALFLKISLFFLGITFVIAYFSHRLIFYYRSRILARYFPSAFAHSFDLVVDFFDLMIKSKDFESDRFLMQISTRRGFKTPRQFKDLPQKVILSTYHKLKQRQLDFKKNPDLVKRQIREGTYQEYLTSFRYQVLNESFNWLLIFIPVAVASGILLPLIIYFYFPVLLKSWPVSWSVAGVLLGILTVLFTLRDYILKR